MSSTTENAVTDVSTVQPPSASRLPEMVATAASTRLRGVGRAGSGPGRSGCAGAGSPRLDHSCNSRKTTTTPTTVSVVAFTMPTTNATGSSHCQRVLPSTTSSATRQSSAPAASVAASLVTVAVAWAIAGVLAITSVAPAAGQRDAPSRRASRNVSARARPSQSTPTLRAAVTMLSTPGMASISAATPAVTT
jgi:hypothetical protein